jgi:hypothetical protein
MAEGNRTIVAIFVVLLLAVAIVVAVWLWPRGGGEETAGLAAEGTPTPEPAPTATLAEQLSERLQGITLKTSDAAVQELAEGLSTNPKLAAWLANDDLIRRFTFSIDNVAAGQSPDAQLEFLRPRKAFSVDEKGGVLVIDPASYHRYDQVADVFASLDTEGTVALYRELEPLIEEAYREVAPPGAQFSDRLQEAFDELLAVPIVEGQPQVEELVVTYRWADDDLESLSAAQRQLLRMGPDNVRQIQEKIRELRAALAAPAE